MIDQEHSFKAGHGTPRGMIGIWLNAEGVID